MRLDFKNTVGVISEYCPIMNGYFSCLPESSSYMSIFQLLEAFRQEKCIHYHMPAFYTAHTSYCSIFSVLQTISISLVLTTFMDTPARRYVDVGNDEVNWHCYLEKKLFLIPASL